MRKRASAKQGVTNHVRTMWTWLGLRPPVLDEGRDRRGTWGVREGTRPRAAGGQGTPRGPVEEGVRALSPFAFGSPPAGPSERLPFEVPPPLHPRPGGPGGFFFNPRSSVPA